MINNVEITEQIADLAQKLDKLGCALLIINKPKNRPHCNIKNLGSEGFSLAHQKTYGKTKVRKMREDAGLSQYQLACAMGVDRNIVLRIEDENRKHTEASMQRFADFFNCTINDLLEE